MESTALAILFVVGKAAIWLALPLALGLWELRRHRRMMAEEQRGETRRDAIPGWLRSSRREAEPGRTGSEPYRTRGPDREPAKVERDDDEPETRRAA